MPRIPRPAVAALLLLAAVIPLAARADRLEPRVLLREAPVIAGAKVPFLIADGGGGFFVSYMTGDSFRMARMRGGQWSDEHTIAGGDLLVNSADFPSIGRDGNRLQAAWSTRHEHGSVVHLARSADGGATWTATPTPHPDVVSQFGFVSLFGDAVFLDGRKLKGGEEGAGDMELRTPTSLLDARVCDCCQTAAAMTSEGPIVAYRDRSADEVRDISIVRRTAKGWTAPKTLHADGWKIQGCPVNGPQLDARGRHVVAAWFTAAKNQPRVSVAFSDDAGATFTPPLRADLGHTTGRVDVAFVDDRSVVVTFVDGGSLYARRVSRDGKIGPAARIAPASGFPRLAVSQQNVGVVWSADDGVHFVSVERLGWKGSQ